jgi:hypothetical protein
MSVHSFVLDLTLRGIDLWTEGGHLRFKAQAGVMVETDKAQLREHKAEIMELLSRLAVDPNPDPFVKQIKAAIAEGRKLITTETIRRTEERWKLKRSITEEGDNGDGR